MAKQKLTDDYVKRYILALRTEAEMAKHDRMQLNKDNFAMYQLKHDFSHKMAGQSKEVLSKTRNATESSKAFFQQALADLGDWYRIEARDGTDGDGMLIKPSEMQKMMNYMLGRSNYFSHVGSSTQSGLLASLAISRVHGKMVPKPKYVLKKEGKGARYKQNILVSDDETWELRFSDIRAEDYYPDPTNSGLYEIDETIMDLHELKKITADDPDYDKSAIDQLKSWGATDLGEADKARETGQNISEARMRPTVKVTNFFGTIVDDVTGDILCENCVATLANDMEVIRMPCANPNWYQKNDLVAAALIEVTNSVWGIAMMDAGTKHNRSLIELFNLMLDAAMKAVWGVNQIRTDVLADPSQITDGVKWGTNLQTNASLPIGGKVMEPVITGEIPGEVMSMFSLLNEETLTSMKTNEIRQGGQASSRQLATAVVASENAITSEFQGIAKNFEEKKIQPELEKACYTICQNWDLIDREVFVSVFGREDGERLAALKPQEVFVSCVSGLKFEVFGISLTLRRQADFRKWTTLLQVIGASPVLIEAFLKEGYDFGKLLGEIMTAVDVNKSKLKGKAPAAPAAQPQSPTMQQPGGAPGSQTNAMSQVPSAANTPTGGLAAAFGGQQGSMNMPSAQAMP